MTARIGCRDLRVRARGRELLHVPALDVPAGTTLAVLGPNGAGKSTLVRALGHLGGLRRSGQVLLDGEPAGARELRPAVAAVLQRPILRRGSVAANAAAGLRMRGLRRGEAHRRAEPWLAALGVAHLAGREARTLSGGEAQRVALARALAVAPRVLLLDEPFAGLDATTRADLLADLRAVLDGLDGLDGLDTGLSGAAAPATVLVTHDRDEASALAGTTALLVAGRIRQLGPTDRVLDEPADADCARLVGLTNLLPPALTGCAELLAAKPEHCRAEPACGAGRGAGRRDGVSVRGTVRRVVPLGGATRVDVDTAEGTLACLGGAGPAGPAPDGPVPGRAVAVTVADADLRVVGAAGPSYSGCVSENGSKPPPSRTMA